MRHGARACWLPSLGIALRGAVRGVLACWLLAGSAACWPAVAVQVTIAQVQVLPGGTFGAPGPVPALDDNAWKNTTLPFVLPRPVTASPDASAIDVAWVRIALPPAAQALPAEALRFYAPRWQTIGQVAVYAGDRMVFRSGAGPVWNGFNHPLWLPLASASDEAPTTVLVRIDHLRSAGAALSTIWVGDEAGLGQRRWLREWLQAGVPYIASTTFLVIGFFAGAVWLVRRESAYGIFSVLSVLFFLRCLHYHLGLEPLPVPEDWFGWMTVHSLSGLVVTTYFFGFRLHAKRYLRLERILIALVLLAAVVTLPFLTVLPQVSLITPLAYLLMMVATVGLSAMGVWSAWRARSGDAMLVAVWNSMAVPTAAHDFLLQNLRINIENLYLLPYTGVGLFAAFLYVVLKRYVSALRDSEQSQTRLEQQLRAREDELTQSHAKLRAIEHEQILSAERARLMQDMHDGLGSSLMGALKAVEHGYDQDLAEVLRACIDDLKLAIDSLEPVQADLLLLLATLRFRLGSRLEQAGVQLRWEVQDVPPLAWLDPRSALHILRILQEILGNAIKHSRAGAVTLTTRQEGESVIVAVEDDGRGFDVAAQRSEGRGLANVRRRAQSIGAQASWHAKAQGTRFELVLPLQPAAGNS
ncbi:MAG: ATP-binding protein [Ramlibacter sp.]